MKNFNFLSPLIVSFIINFMALGQIDNADDSGYISDSQSFWDNAPVLTLSAASAATTLPDEVNNTEEIFFPRWYNTGDKYFYSQAGNGSCAAVATIFYTFTYEINRLRNISGQPDANKYPPNFTWNFLNEAEYQHGSSFESNLTLLRDNGVANGVDWGNFDPTDYLRWMDGYEKYHNSHYNRIEGYSTILFIDEPTNLMTLKHWIADHNEGGVSIGGLAVFSSQNSCSTPVQLPAQSAHAGEWAIVNWANGCNHAWTIVGYCDDIKYDFNNDGQYTITLDINNDGVVNVKDWEIGAFNVAGKGDGNSVNSGLVWIPFKTVAEMQNNNGASSVIVIHADSDYEPLIEVKTNVKHASRYDYGNKISWTENANQYSFLNPNSHSWIDNFFWYSGGYKPLNGIDQSSIEVGFDFSFWFSDEDFGKIFFRPKENGAVYYYGVVEDMSIIDYRWDEEFELYSGQTYVNIPHNTYLNSVFVNYDLIPHESDIESNLTFDSDMVSRFNPTVSNGATLTIGEEVNIDMYESELEIAATSSLVIDDGVTFTAKDGICKIIVDGDISIGSNVSFLAEEGAQLQLVLNKTNLTLSISGATFEGAAIISYIDELTITDYSSFTDGGIYGFNGNYIIEKASFDNSFCIISDGEYKNTVSISECLFFNNGLAYPIKIEDYSDFTIYGCILTNNYFGINIYNSGDGPNTSEISNCEISGCSQAGIQVYNSYVDIVDNIISNNFFGIRSFNNSNVKLAGNTQSLTQTIQDNTIYEVYATSGSFPYYFHYNGIVDEDNTQPMVYFSGPNDVLLNVTNNFWGTNFNASTDLFPTAQFIYTPVWNPGEKSGEVVESMYNNAQEKIELEDYAGAKVDLLEIVNQYPQTLFAEASLKDIFAIEEFGENDFANLQLFLQSDPVIQNYEPLTKLAAFLSNNCEIKLQNWPEAISYFEGIISDPENLEDSIFAIIDLGHTYLLMENGGAKSAYSGTMTQHIPPSSEKYEQKREFLLSLLPGDQMSEEMIKNIGRLNDGELLQNVPNPFSKSTQIWFNINAQSNVVINVYGYTGKKLKSINPGLVEKGRQSVKFNATDLPAGIYFYSIEINGQVSDTKKMTIMK